MTRPTVSIVHLLMATAIAFATVIHAQNTTTSANTTTTGAAPALKKADANACLAPNCLSIWGACGSTAAYCGPACISGNCWTAADVIKNPGGSGRSPSDGGKTGSGSSGSGGSNGGDKKPPVVPTEAPTITRSRGPFAGREDVELCTETADFNKNLSSMFKVDYCPSNVVMREGGGALLMKMNKECGTRLNSVRTYKAGYAEVRMKTATTSGVVTSFITRSRDDKDELDIEWVGKSNFFVDGVLDHTQSLRHQSGKADTSKEFQVYGLEWNQDYAQWYLDGLVVRRLVNDGKTKFPTKEMAVQLGLWDGSETSGWAGTVDFGLAPFQSEIDYVKVTYPCEA